MSKIPRFDIGLNGRMTQSNDGYWVFASDFDSEIEKLRKDAERYRWLRSLTDDSWYFAISTKPCFNTSSTGDELDKAIMKGFAYDRTDTRR